MVPGHGEMEHNMSKTIKLEGRALELALAIDKTMEDGNRQIGELKAQADSIHEAARSRAEKLHEELKHELGLSRDDCCHLDTTYAEEHGMAFVKTGCERSGGIGDLLGQLMGGRAEKKAGGLH